MEVDAACSFPRGSPHDAHLTMDNGYAQFYQAPAKPHLALVQSVARLDHRVGAVIGESVFNIQSTAFKYEIDRFTWCECLQTIGMFPLSQSRFY